MSTRRLRGMSSGRGLLGLALAVAFASGQTAAEAKRLQRMKFDEIVAALQAREGSRVADLGAGDGVFTAPLAKAVGSSGAVYATDISEDALKRLRKRIEESGVKNVVVIQADEDNPRLPDGSLDAVLLVDTYH